MKYLLLFAIYSLSVFTYATGQVPKAMPPDANEFYNNLMPLLRPAVKNIVFQTAKEITLHKANADSIYLNIQSNAALKSLSRMDVYGVTVLILVQASKDADEDIKRMVMEISHKAGHSEEETTTMQNLKLQKSMERKSKIAEEINYLMNKISGNEASIIKNLK